MNQNFRLRLEGCPNWIEMKTLNDVIAPSGDQRIAGIFMRPEFLRAGIYRAWGFAGACDHWQCSGDFTVPRHERMRAFAAVTEAVSVIAPGNHMQQAAGRPAVGIVVDREQASGVVEFQAPRIPKSRREERQLRTVLFAMKNRSAFATAGITRTVAAVNRVGLAEIFPQAKIQQPIRPNRETRQSVVRIISFGLQFNQRLALARFAAAVVFQKHDFISSGEDRAAVIEQQIHRIAEAIGEGRHSLRFARRIEIIENLDAIRIGSFICLRPEVSVVFNRPNPPARIYRDPTLRDDLRFLRH